jgi:RNA recognition motif-containing protein
MAHKLFIGGLAFSTSNERLREVFAEAGVVESAAVVMDRDTGRPRGFAFVEMGSDDEATGAISSLTGREIQGRPINVSEARARAPRSGGGGGGGGYGGGGGGRGGRERSNRY